VSVQARDQRDDTKDCNALSGAIALAEAICQSSLPMVQPAALESFSHEEAQAKIATFILAIRAKRDAQATLILLNANLFDQAAILARSLWEISITISYIATDLPNLGNRYMMDSFARHHRYLTEARRSPTSPLKGLLDHEESVAETAARIDEIDEKFRRQWSGKNLLEMAQSLHAEDTYRSYYSYLCNSSHVASLSTSRQLGLTESGNVMIIDSPSTKMVPLMATRTLATTLLCHVRYFGMLCDYEAPLCPLTSLGQS
jgi:hypothetical protein